PQLGETLRGHLPVLHELRVPLEDRFREQLIPGNLDPELPLQAEDDVQKVDRLGPEVPLQGRGRCDLILVHIEGLDEGGRDLLEDLISRHRTDLRYHWLTEPLPSEFIDDPPQ